MSMMSELDIEVADKASHLFRRLEHGWLDGDLTGGDILVELRKFVKQHEHLLGSEVHDERD